MNPLLISAGLYALAAGYLLAPGAAQRRLAPYVAQVMTPELNRMRWMGALMSCAASVALIKTLTS